MVVAPMKAMKATRASKGVMKSALKGKNAKALKKLAKVSKHDRAKPASKSAKKALQAADEAESDEELRDMVKSRKFSKIYDSLPASVRNSWDAAQKGPNKRKDQSKIINSALMRSKDGKLVVNRNFEDTPVFGELKERNDKKYFDENQGGIARQIRSATLVYIW